MEGKSTSPRRPRGPGTPIVPSVAEEHGHSDPHNEHFGGTSRSSLFGLFRMQPRRQPSRSSLRTATAPRSHNGGAGQSLRSTAGESFSAAFDAMSFNANEAGIESPQQAHESASRVKKMLKAATNYKSAIENMSLAATEFGSALYDCADTKGAASGHTSLPNHNVDVDLQAAGGLHLLISNHLNLLASSLDAQVVDPVRTSFTAYERKIAQREAEFKSELGAKMSALRRSDQQRKGSRRRGQGMGDLLAYRSTLLDLTSQIDDINRLKFEFLSDIHALSVELAESLHSSIASAVTAEIEVFESVARKGWSGGGLDGLLAGCPDPFEAPRKPKMDEDPQSPHDKSEEVSLDTETRELHIDIAKHRRSSHGHSPETHKSLIRRKVSVDDNDDSFQVDLHAPSDAQSISESIEDANDDARTPTEAQESSILRDLDETEENKNKADRDEDVGEQEGNSSSRTSHA